MNAMTLHRLGHRCLERGWPVLARVVEYLIFLLYNSVVPSTAQIGAGTRFAYGGIGVVLHKGSVIGAGCVIGQGITLGAREAYVSEAVTIGPTVGDNVYLGAGCRIIGAVHVGHSSVVAPNAVVTKDLPPHSIVGGVPFRVLGTTEPGYQAIRDAAPA